MDKFCFAPWTNIEILPSGDILPCCKFQAHYYSQGQFNIISHNLDQYRTSKFLANLKQQFREGQWPKGCERCQLEEQSGIPSKRQLDFDRWQNIYQNHDLETDGILTLSVALGNTCNLKCIMCGPQASSSWAREHRDLYGEGIVPLTKIRKKIIPGLIDMAPNLAHIDIHGGEPFLSSTREHHTLLDHYIHTGQSNKISLHYTSNGTIIPGLDFQERWQHYKEIDLQISIDGISKRYEYIRFPSRWVDLCQNISHLRHLIQNNNNMRLSIAHTVSAFNIMYIDEFLSWCQHNDLPRPWTGKLHRPARLRPTVWPESVKMSIMHHLSQSTRPEVQNWCHHLAQQDDSCHFDEFRSFVHRHDQYRDQNFSIAFPELAAYI